MPSEYTGCCVRPASFASSNANTPTESSTSSRSAGTGVFSTSLNTASTAIRGPDGTTSPMKILSLARQTAARLGQAGPNASY
jgi:hypothetical protein